MCVYIRKNIKCPLRITQSLSLSQIWFQNRRAKLRRSLRETRLQLVQTAVADLGVGHEVIGHLKVRLGRRGDRELLSQVEAEKEGWLRTFSVPALMQDLLFYCSTHHQFLPGSVFCLSSVQKHDSEKKWRQFNVRVVSHCFISVSGTNTGNCFLALKINSSSWTYW